MICKKSLLTVMGSGFFISDTLIVPFTKEPSKVDFYPLQSERNCLLYVSGSLSCVEQVSTTVPKSAILRFCPSRETCWGVPSPNPACRPRGLHIIHFRASAKVHSFRPSSSPHATRFAGLARGPHERRPRKEVTPCERNTTRPTAAAL